MALALLEYLVRQLLLGDKANPAAVAEVGAAMVVAGESIRKAAIVRI